ncbi:hypothetical protein AYO20_02262 [Fonsecaea nubica]|uniref:Uncharacterized protein n=1 Tax=Fonsecaea nubica TaxID=856822 RepID=A0A178DAG9_9EURO|nr:hypothetical protein AYO20_02262 [Fonsecaea nubica]OAL38612.1 hypothetical protein AYO20_02262 [Fonsecaea nubica]
MSKSSSGVIAFHSHTYTHKYLQPSRVWSEALEVGKAVARRGKPTSLWHQYQAPEETQTWLTRLDRHVAETQTSTRYSSVRAQSSYRGRRPSESQITSSTRRTISSEPSIRDSDLLGDSDYHHHWMQQETIRRLEVLLAQLEDRTRSLTPISADADCVDQGHSTPTISIQRSVNCVVTLIFANWSPHPFHNLISVLISVLVSVVISVVISIFIYVEEQRDVSPSHLLRD